MKEEKWLLGILNKRPECALLIHALVISGLARGCVTAEDAHNIPVSSPNCRGAAMKMLGKFGFKKGSLIRGTTERSHKHWMFEWELYDRSKAEELVGFFKSSLYKIEPDQQLKLKGV